MEGSIIKGVGGLYSVSTDQGMITSKARGAFRKEGITPVVGDRV
ncbi:MAG: ribosome biogenesis GTPase RsgA, partial [Clostridia bacterium]|nr:ribosome biogenesis GTPase RsgA [Clostridia bacterium]